MTSFDFWFSIGSTYTYLTVERIGDLARENGIDVQWRPFSVRALMQEMNNIPFAGKPAKERYMWRDLERRFNADSTARSRLLPDARTEIHTQASRGISRV